MQIEIFCLCKDVRYNSAKQPTLSDIFDVKIAMGEPCLIEPFIVFGSIRFYKNELGRHEFSFILREATGKVLISSQEIVDLTAIPLDRESFTYGLECHMGQTGLKFGRYDFSLEQGQKKLASTPLYVLKAERKSITL